MADPSASDAGEDGLTTTLHLLALPCVSAILSGALLHYSSFFGGTLVLVFAISLLFAIINIRKEESVTVMTIEVQLLGVSIPIIATLSVISAVQLPVATTALNLLLIAIVVVHLALLKRTVERLNLRILLGYSFALVIASVIGTGIIWARWADGFSYVFPTCTVIIYALVPLNDSTFRLRDKLPISTMESAALFASFLGVAACFAASNYFPAALPGSILATAVCFLFYVRFDHLEHKMRIPHEQWAADTASHSGSHAALKVFPLLTIVSWAGMGAYGSWAIREDAAERNATCGTQFYDSKACQVGSRVVGLALFSILIAIGHMFTFMTEPPVPRGQKCMRPFAYVIAAAVAVLLTKVAIACYYLFCPHATVPAWVAMTIVGSLCSLVTCLLDNMRHVLTYPLHYMSALMLACIFLGIYFLSTGIYLFHTHSEDDRPPYLAVFLTAVLVCALLVIHYILALVEQGCKEMKFKEDPAYFSRDGTTDGAS